MLKWLTQYANGKVGYKARKQKYDVTGRADASPEKALWIGGVEADLPEERSHGVSRKQTVKFDGRLDDTSLRSRHLNPQRHPPDKPSNVSQSHTITDGRYIHGHTTDTPRRTDFREQERLLRAASTPVRDYATIPGHDRVRGRASKTSHRGPVPSVSNQPGVLDSSRVRPAAGAGSSCVAPALGDITGSARLWPGRQRHLVVEYTSDDSPDRQGADPRPRRLSPSAESRVVASAGGIADDEFFIICPPNVAMTEWQKPGEPQHRGVEPGRDVTLDREAVPEREAAPDQEVMAERDVTSDRDATSERNRAWSSTLLEKVRRRHGVGMGRARDALGQPPGEPPASVVDSESRANDPIDLSEHRRSRLDQHRARIESSPTPEQLSDELHGDYDDDVGDGPVTPVEDGEPKSVILEDSGVTRISVTPAGRSRSEENAAAAAAAPERPARYLSTSLPRPRAANRASRPAADHRWVLTLPVRSRTSPPPTESRSASEGRKSESACRDELPEGHNRDTGDRVSSAGGVTYASDKIHVRFVNRVTREAVRSRSWSVGRPGELSANDSRPVYDTEARSGREPAPRLGRHPGARSGQSVCFDLPPAKIGSHVITNGSLPRMTRQSRSGESAREPPRTIAVARPSASAPAAAPAAAPAVRDPAGPPQGNSPQRSASFRLTEPDEPAAKRVTVVPRRSHSEPRGPLGPETSVDDYNDAAPSSAGYAHIATLPRAAQRRPRQTAAATQTSPRGSPEPRDSKKTRDSKDDHGSKESRGSHESHSSRERRTASERRPVDESVESIESDELIRPRSASADSAELGRIYQQARSSLQHVTLRSASCIATRPAPLTNQGVSASALTAEGREHLMWCTDDEFDRSLEQLSQRGLLELIQLLQDAMLIEQQTFDSLQQQLESAAAASAQRQRLSAALCTSQARLTRLCGRSMRCFTQQAMRARQRVADRPDEPEVGSSPVDTVNMSANFKQNLTFFQKAAHNLTRSTPPVRSRPQPRRSSVGSDGSSGSSVASAASVGDDDFEPVLFVNGRPRYVTSEAAGAPIGGSAVSAGDAADGAAVDDGARTGAERAERAAQKVRIGGTAAERIRSGGRSAAERAASSSPARTGRSQQQPANASNAVTDIAKEKNFDSRERSSSAPAKREKAAPSSHSSEKLSSSASSKRERASSSETSSISEKPSSRSSARRDSERQSSTDSEPRTPDVQPPRRKPYIRFSSVENHLSHDDLTYFKQTIGILPGGGGITRTQSCQEGLDAPARPAPVSRTLSFSCLADVGGEPRSLSGSRTSLRRAPSVEEILESVKALRVKRQQDEMVRNSEPETEYQNVGIKSSSRSGKGRPSPWSGVQFSGPVRSDDVDDPALTPDDACYENVSAGGQAVYQNSPLKSEVIYDQPVKQRRRRRKAPEEPQQLYENVQFSEPAGGEYQNTALLSSSHPNLAEPDAVYENVEKGVVSVSGNGLLASGQYDVPRTASHIYDAPQRTRVKHVQPVEAGEYDSPRPTYGPGRGEPLPTRSTQIVLKGGAPTPAIEKTQDCDRDSLDGDGGRRPDIPSPDYGSDGDDVDGIPNDYIGDDQLDEGLGESDARSYYNEDPGLEVILEEPEDEYVTSSEEEEEQQEPPQSRSLHSLEGSEGIGSAEGDSGSNASVESSSGVHSPGGSPTLRPPSDEREERIQKDRCVEVYPETMRQRKQAKKHKQVEGKQSWSDASHISRRADDSSKTSDSPTKIKKLLPSVKALKSQFESAPASDAPRRVKERSPPSNKMASESVLTERQPPPAAADPSPVSGQRVSPGAAGAQRPASGSPSTRNGSSKKVYIPDDPVEAIYDKFGEVDERMLKQKITTLSWDPTTLVSRLYEVPEPAQRPKDQEKGYINIEGWLEKLPSGRKKATFWNAWKRRYFKAKDGFLYYYQTNTTEKPSMVLQLMGGHVEAMESSVVGVDDGVPQTLPMLGLDDGKGRYVVVRCGSRQEAERWTRALLSHTVEDYNATYVQPVPVPPCVTTSRRCVVIDLGSSSIRAGVLHDQPTLPQLFLPAAMVTSRDGGAPVFGAAALRPEARAGGTLSFPLRPSSKITKYSVDVPALCGLLQLTFRELRINPAEYCVQLSLPRSFNTATLGEILRLLFDKFGAQGVNLTHQSILAMWSYNATSGVVVDVGDRMDVVPVIDGYIVEGGVSRVPYGGARIQDHLRHFLLQKHHSLVTEVESLLLRYVMERLCFVSEQYGADLRAFAEDPASMQKTVSVKEFLGDNVSWKRITLDSGRFQATEGLFTPDAWGLDNKGVHKLVHKAVQECSVDIRKEMVRSIYLAGGVTLLPGFAERLQAEMDRLTPASVTPKVHASPYRYHAAYLGACVLAGSEGFQQAMVPRSSWLKLGVSALKKWTV